MFNGQPSLPGKAGDIITWSGLHGAADALAVAQLAAKQNSLVVVITTGSDRAHRWRSAVNFFLDAQTPTLQFPDWETLPYDLAFLDISMPEMDGREALAEVLSRQRRNRLARQINRPDIPPLPIIALTANVMSGDRESYLADGFTAVISKPFEERELLEAILNFGPAPEDRDPLAPLDAQSDEAHGIDLIVLDQLAERLGDGFTQTSVEIFTAEINQRLSAMAAVSGSGPASGRSNPAARAAA